MSEGGGKNVSSNLEEGPGASNCESQKQVLVASDNLKSICQASLPTLIPGCDSPEAWGAAQRKLCSEKVLAEKVEN